MIRHVRFTTLLSAAAIATAGATGIGISPAVGSSGTSTVTCAGPSSAEAQFFSNAKSIGIHAQQAVYDRSRIGCIPLAANGLPKTNLIQTALSQQHALPSLTSNGGAWTSIGPSPISSGPNADSGRILSMAFDAALNGGTVFAGTAGGGVWSSVSPFTTWTTHTDGMPILAINTVAVDPSNPTGMTIYAGTGEGSGGYDTLYGQGVYKSTDGGTTWAVVTGAPPGGWGRMDISRIVVNSLGIVYAAVTTPFGGSGGVFISDDGGVTWSAGTGVTSGTNSVTDLAIDASNNVYAAVGASLNTQIATGIYECIWSPLNPCTSSSLLNTWTLIGGGPGGTNSFPNSATVDNLKIAAVHTTLGGGGTALYVVASKSANPNKLHGVFRQLPGSATWTQVAPAATAAPYENQAWYDIYIFADPADVTGGTVYFGLSDIYTSTNASGLAPTWTNLTNVYGVDGTGVHPDQHGITSNGGMVFFGNDGGAWQSTDGGTTFTDINGNLTTLQFYDGGLGTNAAEGCTANCDPTGAIGGLQDNGTVQTTGGATQWTPDPGFGDGGYALIDPHNNNNRYGENANGGIVNSLDGFTTANNATTGGTCGASNFMAPMRLDPGTPTTLLVGMRDLCETTNANTASPTWTDISKPGGVSVTGAPVGAIAVSDAGGAKIYIADDNGASFFTSDNGVTWTSMDTGAAGGPLAAIAANTGGSGPGPSTNFGLQITGLAADPAHSGVVYAVLNGFQGGSPGHVFKWTNTGGPNGTWQDISGNLPDEPYDSVAVDPVKNVRIFVGGITGAFVTTNNGAAWSQLGTGLPNVQVDGLQVSLDGSKIVAFTHGRSAWSLSLSTVTVAPYSRLMVRSSRGTTTMTWRSATRVAGFNVYSGSRRLNQGLVTSRTNSYTFRFHGIVHNPRLVAVQR